MQREIDHLRQLLDDERAARREERQRSDALLANALHRLEALAPPAETPQDAIYAPQTSARSAQAPDPMKPVSDSLALVWRRWWQRMRGE
jgi:hypothetical protein